MAGLDVNLMRKMGRRMNDEMIEANPVDVVIKRWPEVDDGAGGEVKGPPTTLPPQKMRMIDIGSNRVVDRTTDEGRVMRPSTMFLCEPDADVQQHDEADPGDGYTYKIGKIHTVHHRLRAEAFRNEVDPT